MKSQNRTLKILALFVLAMGISFSVFGQSLTAPETHGVNGGRVLGMAVAQVDYDSVLIYISAESANSMFYTGAGRYWGFSGQPVFENHEWTVMPSLGSEDGYGSGISKIDAHDSSGYVFFIHENTLYRTHPSLSTNLLVDSMVQSLLVIDDELLYVRNGVLPGETWLVHGTIDGSGSFTEDASSPYVMGFTFNDPPAIVIDPTTDYPHLFLSDTTAQIMVISDPYDAISSSSIITSYVHGNPDTTKIEWTAFGIAPDGRMFMSGGPVAGTDPNHDKIISYTDDQGLNWVNSAWNIPGPPGGIPGNNFAFPNYVSGNYEVFNGAWMSATKGSRYSFVEMGHDHYYDSNKGNSGPVEADPIVDEVVYLTTNVGMGWSWPNGDTIYDYNDGFTAVQVYDMQMTDDYNVGFVASKSGIRKVNNFNAGTSNARWRHTVFPQGDGSPYFSVAFLDTNVVYAANKAIYKTTNGGAQSGDWTEMFDPTLDGPYASLYNFPRHHIHVDGLRINPWDDQEIMAGWNRTDGVDKGGLFVSEDGGSSWSQILVEVSTNGGDINVTDVEWAIDWDGDTVCFVSVEYDASSPQGQGIYSVKKSGGTYNVTHEVLSPYSFYDIQLSPSGDSLLVAGHDGSEAFVQIRNLNTPAWTSASTTGVADLPSALALGGGYIFMAAEHNVYMLNIAGPPSWSTGYSYPNGTEINFLFYDELLVGTSHGLYGHDIDTSGTPTPPSTTSADSDYFGASLDISDEYAVVGAWGRAGKFAEVFDTVDVGDLDDMGAAYVYKFNSGNNEWVEWQRLLALDRDSTDGFGFSVAMNDDFIAVGAPFEQHDEQIGMNANPMESAGSVYIYYKNSLTQHVDSVKLVAPDRSPGQMFGYSIAMLEGTLAIGAPGDSGAVYLYRLGTTGWVFEEKVQPNDGNSGDFFGAEVVLHEVGPEEWLFVGSPEHDYDTTSSNYLDGAGAAYIYTDSGFGMSFFVKTQAEHRQANAAFGSAITVSDMLLMISAPYDRTDNADANELDSAGAVYGWVLNTGTYAFKLVCNDRQSGDQFGEAMDISDEMLYVGMPGRSNEEGKLLAYYIDIAGSSISEVDRIAAEDSSSYAWFGAAVAVSDSTILTGAPNAQASTYAASSTIGGAAYFLTMSRTGDLQPIIAAKPFADQELWPADLIVADGPLSESDEVDIQAEIKMYPNPTTGELYVEAEKASQIIVRDLHGRILSNLDVNGQRVTRISLNNLSAGLYIIEVFSESTGVSQQGRIFKK